eukprot:5434865-Prymnesium_polylepis.1
MQQLDVPNEHAERNEANAETQRLARGSDDPRVPPAPAPALERLFAEAFETFDEPPATTRLE